MPYYPPEGIVPATAVVPTSGTFTPVLKLGGASVGITYGTQSGKYTKTGNICAFVIDITLTSKGSSVGAATITGLPFVSIAGITQAPPVGLSAAIVTAPSVGAWIQASSSQIDLLNANINWGGVLTDANLSNTSTLRIGGSYLTT